MWFFCTVTGCLKMDAVWRIGGTRLGSALIFSLGFGAEGVVLDEVDPETKIEVKVI